MLKAHKRIYIAIICFVILGIAITGFRQQEKNEPPINMEPIQEAVAPNSLQKDNLIGTTEIEPTNDTSSIDIFNNSEQKQEPPEVQFTDYPSGHDFIENIIDGTNKIGQCK